MTSVVRCMLFKLGALFVVVATTLGCTTRDAVPESNFRGAQAGIGRERVGSISVGASIDSVLTGASLLRDEERRAIGGGDRERFLTIAVSGDTLEIVPAGGRVLEIALRSTRLRTSDNLGVGTTAAELARRNILVAQIDGSGLAVNLVAHCGLDLLIEGVPGETGTVFSTRKLSQLGERWRVSQVVVRACLVGQ